MTDTAYLAPSRVYTLTPGVHFSHPGDIIYDAPDEHYGISTSQAHRHRDDVYHLFLYKLTTAMHRARISTTEKEQLQSLWQELLALTVDTEQTDRQ